MAASAGNLDSLLGVYVPAPDLYSLHVQSFTTTGTGVSERIASITVDAGDPDHYGINPISPTAEFTVSAFDNTAGTATLAPGFGICPNPSVYTPSYLFAFSPNALLLSTLPSYNIALGLDLGINQDVSLALFSAEPLANGTTITFSASDTYTDSPALVCFCAGTQITTPDGEVAVEHLEVGDIVTTASGAKRRISWIGSGRVLATRGRRSEATPVIVRRNALADNVPDRDLRITKGHSLYIDGVLIPVENLINHRSILWDDRAQEVEIYHIELDTHDVLLANGAPAESYRDDGNRWMFRNWHSRLASKAMEPCAPILTGGPDVDAVWGRLLDRSGPRPGIPLTDEPDLHMLADGRRVDASGRSGDAYVFDLPFVPEDLRIVSRAAAPDELGTARDARMLGVALLRMVARQETKFTMIDATDYELVDGFHSFEIDNGFRWTNGNAAVPRSLFGGFQGAFELVLHIACSTRYMEDDTTYLAA